MKKKALLLYAFVTPLLYAQQPPENLNTLTNATTQVNETPGNTPLHKVRNSQEALALIQAGADIHAKNWLNHTPLHIAVNNGLPDVVKILIEAGADTEARDRWGRTPGQMAYTMTMAAFFTQCVEKRAQQKK
ncbi:hypothetical protein CVU75_00215 [Candidatus Dependentiae bacterium HGW-Dependentiae-1]|nr:MAG: hypothetical protein CVU75_00215 [Candidatus Dependentiae bacterium HGW-Dependentiae-1]